MATILDYALMSQAVYDNNPSVGNWACSHFRAGLGSGLQAAVFSNGSATVAAFKGTTPSQVNDLVADLKLGVGMNTSYFADAMAFVEQYANVEGLVVTGHSLGGAIAQIVGNRRRIPFVTFNAPGVALVATRNLPTATAPMTAIRTVGAIASMFRHPIQALQDIGAAFHISQGINIRLSGDMVSQIGLHYGEIFSLQASGNPLSQHGIGEVINVLQACATGSVQFP